MAYQVADTLAGHLDFALKHEGVNLAILSALFQRVEVDDIVSYVQSRPNGIHTRRLWFFYEFLTQTPLPIPDLSSTCGYVDALDSEAYITRPEPPRLSRYRVRDNLLGSPQFCPVVRRTDAIQNASWQDLKLAAETALREYDSQIIGRAVNYLYTKETRSSFAIEHESPPASRVERFGQALQAVQQYRQLSKEVLLELQSLVLDTPVAASDYRDEQNYVGETLGTRELVHFISPKPEDVPELMSGWLAFCHRSDDINPIIAAAVAAFGFVFIHPFDDGNGRIHRYLIHHFLANRGVTPPGLIFPVSATMLNSRHEYDACLESFSESIMPLVDYELADDFSLTVNNDTAHLYRYLDATRQCEYLYDCIARTIDNELKAELDTLVAFDRARQALDAEFDLPERLKNLLLKLCWQGHGTLSNTKRKTHFSQYSDAELDRMVERIAGYFRPPKA